MDTTSSLSPFAVDREAAKLHKRWTLARDRFDRCTEATWSDRNEAEERAREQLTIFVDANDLAGTDVDPRGSATTDTPTN